MKLWLWFAIIMIFTALAVSQAPPHGGPHGGGPHGGPHGGGPRPSRPPTDPERPIDHEPVNPTKYPYPQDSSDSQEPINPEKPSSSSSSSSSQDSDSDAVVCLMIAVQCPDGNYAISNSNCDTICGEAPIGGLSWNDVEYVRKEFAYAFSSVISSASVSSLHGETVKIQTPPESYNDYCIRVILKDHTRASTLPDVYNGVRVIYSDKYECSPFRCPNGELIGCEQVCPDEIEVTSHVILPFIVVFSVVALAACCCCCRRQRQKKCKAASEALYPSAQYELVKQQEPVHQQISIPVPLPPQMMMAPMMYPPPMGMPPMPPVPPHMMMPNGSYPVMMQGPNGMWFPVMPRSEDA